jgi:hypothetical protein
VALRRHMTAVPPKTNATMLLKTIPANTCSTTLHIETEIFSLLMSISLVDRVMKSDGADDGADR